MSDHLSTAVKLAPIVERVHGSHHPELTRVRELALEIAASPDAAQRSDLFRQLRSITGDYTVPSDGCEAFAATYDALKAADAEHSAA